MASVIASERADNLLGEAASARPGPWQEHTFDLERGLVLKETKVDVVTRENVVMPSVGATNGFATA